MSASTLIDELRRKSHEDLDSVWQKARTDAEGRRMAATQAFEEQRKQSAQELAAKAAEFERAAALEAEAAARGIRAAAKSALADRLHRLAIATLSDFRKSDYPRLFASLKAELPDRTWQRVTVNPADENLAKQQFPESKIASDPAINGGFNVECEGGRVRISNTLEARLENAWPEILPGLMKAVLEEISHS